MGRLNPEHIWTQYTLLYRYAKPRAVAGIKGPPPKSPPSQQLIAATKLTRVISQNYPRCPIPVEEDYFAYLFLFVQLLRCSAPKRPDYNQQRGFYPLCWYPLSTLAGKDDKAQAFWDNWYRREWEHNFPHPEGGYFHHKYPILPDKTEFYLKTLSRHIQSFTRIKMKLNLDAKSILQQFDATGQQKSKQSEFYPWNPWLVIGTPLAWKPGSDDKTLVDSEIERLLPEIENIITNRKVAEIFISEVLPATSPKDRDYITDGFDDFVADHLPHLNSKWQRLKERIDA